MIDARTATAMDGAMAWCFMGGSFWRWRPAGRRRARAPGAGRHCGGSARPAGRRPVVAADGEQPVVAGVVLLAQDLGGDAEVAIRVQQVAGLPVAVPLVAQV